ncbi:hypothetical protein H257_08652 [Aphanomyces astaci]|uniref:VWFA domain-containing protein n=1 Tax=Aphanomyces astaci TaxID=112090 RepID=W4GDQ0_APHAT|nr:hypothetical protein H257_08652 [Aphanomyces astaci]ETV77822.1 hypothetical protein H257_08652 [Aphanomyces astaci]RQM18959.1 hypothetical protein B5M09_004819 [Aphanomyces astaci]|eukprot:XP_009832932.1 hypothetical protein H257_08652 [Aphanomyces astaci]
MSPFVPPVTSTPSPSIDSKASILLTSTAERREIAASVAETTFVNCHLAAPAVEENDRKPVDLVVVLDRSGSMHGDKLSLCKRTMDFLAQQLAPHDRVALISYDTYVTTDLHLTKMNADGKAKLAAKVAAIQAGSCTNLSGGLLAGVDEIQRPTRFDNGEPNPVQSVLLLTDGQANEGVTSADGLAKLLDGLLAPQVSLHTFGYGSDHDASLLGRLADIGRGSYYFVQNVDGVALAFASCLGGLLSVVGQNIKVEVVASPGALIACIKTKRPVTTITDQVHFEVDMGDMFAEESRDLLVQVQLTPQTPAEKMDLVEFRMRYVNVLQSTMEKASTTVTVARPVAVTNDNVVDESVVAQKLRVTAVEAIEAAQQQAKKGNLREGRQALQNVITSVMQDMASFGAPAKAQAAHLLADLNECTANMQTQTTYQTRGHGRMQQKIQSHWMQRQNNIEVEEESLDMECAAGTFGSDNEDEDKESGDVEESGDVDIGDLFAQRSPAPAPRARMARSSAAPPAPPAPGGYSRIGNTVQMKMMKKAFKVANK